jgi:hypothetical protein
VADSTNDIIVRALSRELTAAETELRGAFQHVGNLVKSEGGSRYGYDNPRTQVSKALEIIGKATKRYDDTQDALTAARTARNDATGVAV